MPFDRHIVALGWREGEYAVMASAIFNTIDEVDWEALEQARPLADVTGPTLYADRATVIPAEEMPRYVIGAKARQFVEVEAKDAFLFLVHHAEWESGLGD